MLYYGRIDVFERTDVNKTSESKECDICHYWKFLYEGFRLQPDICNEFYDALMMSMKLSDIAFLNINGADYRCIINRISKNEAINLLKIADLIEKSGRL